MSVKVSDEPDTFLLGPDAKIHFTDTHLTLPDGGLEQGGQMAKILRLNVLVLWA